MTVADPQLLALLLGGMSGALFFGGLWWTVRKGMSVTHPLRYFAFSLALRCAPVTACFVLVSRWGWLGILLCTLGFFGARILTTRLLRFTSLVRHAA
jgi:F1F0 ATPase subunit 2